MTLISVGSHKKNTDLQNCFETFPFFCSQSVNSTKMIYGNMFIFVFLEPHSLTGPLFPIGIEYLIYIIFLLRFVKWVLRAAYKYQGCTLLAISNVE